MRPPILQLISSNQRRGAEIYAIELRDQLRRLGRDMELVALRDAGGGLDVPTLSSRRFGGLRTLRQRARSGAALLAHGSDTLPATVLAGAGTGVPFIYRSIGDPAYWSARLDRRWRVSAELRRAAAIATTFAGAADALISDYGIDARRVHVIPNGRRADQFPLPSDLERAVARRALVGEIDGPLIVVVGALSPEKDPQRAVRAVAQLAGAHLVLVGSGPLADTVRRYAESLAPGRVHLAGSLDDPGVAYRAADVAMIPSRTEGFPGVAIEAGLSGVPVVATDVGGVRSVVSDGETGLVVPSDRPDLDVSALHAALRDRVALGTAARTRCVENFDMARIAATWDDLLDAVLT